MTIQKDIAKVCNFFLEATDWVQQEFQRNGQILRSVKKLGRLPDRSGVYWVRGTVILPDGERITAVFVIDTDTGGEILNAFWHVHARWYDQNDPELPDVLGRPKSKMFPYDYELEVPLERDAYHG